MKRTLAFFAVLGLVLVSAPSAHASLEVSWRTNVVASSTDVAIGSGGAVYVVGKGPPGAIEYLNGRATLTRLTTSGQVVWSRAWQPRPERPGAFETSAVAVVVGDDGAVYVAGTVRRRDCEGGGWFIRSYDPSGRFLDAAPAQKAWHCRPPIPLTIRDIDVRGGLVVAATAHTGCCGDSVVLDGYIRAFTTTLRPLWRTNFEPPAPTDADWFDVADAVQIGPDGVYAAGWAATEGWKETQPLPAGSMMVEKIDLDGTMRWARRPGVPMGYDGYGSVSMVLGDDRMTAGVEVRGGGLWLGRMTLAGTPVWHRTWGGASEIRAQLGEVALDANGRIWMTGTRRDRSDNGSNPFVRRYRRTGVLTGSSTIDPPAKVVVGRAVATLGGSGFVVGTRLAPATGVLISGEVWRVHA